MIVKVLLALFQGIVAFLFRLGVRFKSLLVNSIGYLVNGYTFLLVVCHMILVFLAELWGLLKKRSTDFARHCVQGLRWFLRKLAQYALECTLKFCLYINECISRIKRRLYSVDFLALGILYQHPSENSVPWWMKAKFFTLTLLLYWTMIPQLVSAMFCDNPECHIRHFNWALFISDVPNIVFA